LKNRAEHINIPPDSQSVGRVRKANVGVAENGSGEAVSASIQKLTESTNVTAITIGTQYRINYTYCEWYNQ
jgi:hypothetical protein